METDDTNLSKEAPLLFSLKKKNVHSVPEGFFQNLEIAIRGKYPRANRRNFRKIKKWTQLSVAASIAFALFFTGVKMISGKRYLPVETHRMIYTVEDGDMDSEESYLR